MKQLWRLLVVAVMAASFVMFISKPMAASAGVNDFEITDFKMDMYLSRDAENRSTLKTVESITAEFPDFDQNHGLERAIPKSYESHSTSLKIESVTDAGGKPWNYSQYDDGNGNSVVRIGDADTYVHGVQTFNLTYTERDVTRYFPDTKSEEFYWDTNGTEWLVPIRSLTVRLRIDNPLSTQQTGNFTAYRGPDGSRNQWKIEPTELGYSTTATDLEPGENVTLAVGFKPQTFAAYQMTTQEKLTGYWVIANGVTGPIGLTLVFAFLYRAYRKSNRLDEINVIVPEYLPPKDISVSTAGSVSRKPGKVFAAQLVDLAVRHFIKIYQTREKSFFRAAKYEIEIVRDISSLKEEEQEVLKDIFNSTSVGSRLDMSSLKNNTRVGRLIEDNKGKLDKSIAGQYGLRAKNEEQSAWYKRAAKYSFLSGLLTLSPLLVAAALVAIITALVMKPLTDAGLALARYLKGLEMYIKAAETDRLQMLQSPEGAAKLHAPVDTNDSRQLIKLYERVLPYAILFGHEKDWNKQLGQYYDQTGQTPVWYAGSHGSFNPSSFSSAISSFSTAASSSSGGSSGGGSSGGGGGGGGGGGW